MNKFIPTRIQCPKQAKCSVPYCPLIDMGRTLRGEPACPYLLESVKAGGAARIRAVLGVSLVEAVLHHSNRIWSTPRTGEIALQAALKRASQSGSKIAAAAKLNQVAA